MAELSSKFSRDDIDVLIDAMGDWESIGNHEYNVMHMVKNYPMPDRDEESYDFVKNIKEHFRKREKEIKNERSVRQERAILVKAKLVLLRQEAGINQLLDVAIRNDEEPAPKEASSVTLTEADQNRLELAEFYIKDLGVWDMYQKFLVDRGVNPSVDDSEEEKSNGWFHQNGDGED